MTLREAARAVVENARDQGRDECMDDLVDEQLVERLRAALDRPEHDDPIDLDAIFVGYANDKGPTPVHRALERARRTGVAIGTNETARAIAEWLRRQPVDRYTTYDSLAAQIEDGEPWR